MIELILLGLAPIFFAWGYATARYKVFPYRLLARGKTATVGGQKFTRPRMHQFELFQPRVDVVMLGDSLTEQGLWWEIFPSLRLANRGVGGDTTERCLARMAAVLATQPKRAFVMLGINDIAQGVPLERTLANYRAILETLVEAGIDPVVQSTLPARDRPDWRNNVAALNTALRALCETAGWRFLDLAPDMSDERGLRAEYTFDGTHLSARGYQAWARQIEDEIAR